MTPCDTRSAYKLEKIPNMTTYSDQIRQFSQRHNLSESSVQQLANGLLSTGGGQVQFNIPEFGGLGQWMPGMVMAGSLFDHGLKARVDGACSDIAQAVRSGSLRPPAPAAPAPGSPGVSLSWSPNANWWAKQKSRVIIAFRGQRGGSVRT